jgi:hypothetical protein
MALAVTAHSADMGITETATDPAVPSGLQEVEK